MYQSFFGFEKRPFNAMPDPSCFIPLHEICEAVNSLVSCVVQARGIGVLTAPSGLGKTLVCQRLVGELEAEFTTVFLPSANFLTRRSLLQAVLFELGQSYVRLGDQELRLAILSALRRLRPGYRGLALIVDEAHLLAPRMLEELRALTNFSEAGEPLMRLVVSGSLQLDEALSQPSLDAFNQRIGAHVVLQPLTRQQSAEYVQRRTAWAGANFPSVFASGALDVICEASDGSPRCLNQLCDHSLLLAYLRGQQPLEAATVLDALDELKQLPLTWNNLVMGRRQEEPQRSPSRNQREAILPSLPLVMESDEEKRFPGTNRSTNERTTGEPRRCVQDDEVIVPRFDSDLIGAPSGQVASVEFGADDRPASESSFSTFDLHTDEPAVLVEGLTTMAPYEISATVGEMNPAEANNDAEMFDEAVEDMTVGPEEEVVIDRYAALDAAISRLTRTMLSARAVSRETAARERERLAPSAVLGAGPLPVLEDEQADADEVAEPAFDVVLPEEDADIVFAEDFALPAGMREEDDAMLEPAAAGARLHQAPAIETTSRPDAPPPPHADVRKPLGPERPYQFLFSELRRRQRI